jgi:hypothetical protein
MPSPSSAAPPAAPPLSEGQRARGRRLAIASHPAGNAFRMVFTQHLPTLALVALGASELLVGVQSAFVYLFIALQLPTLRLVGWASKRRILVASHVVAVGAALPLVFWDALAGLPGEAAVALAMASFACVAVAVCVGETVWFPLLRAYVEPARIGAFFGVLRTGWHLALIAFYLLSQWWLARHPGSFGPLFALGFGLGVLRIFLIVRMPERDERTGERIRAREALALLRHPPLRAYLSTVAWGHAVRVAGIPFVIVMLRRVDGLSAGDVLYTTVAHFTGGLVSLIAWGRAVDRFGAVPVLRTCAVGQALLFASLAVVDGATLPLAVGWFFALSVLASGFGVADTHVMFGLTPPESPTRTLVLGAVVVGVASGLAPVVAGAVLDVALGGTPGTGREVYRAFFAVLGALALGTLWPLRGVRPAPIY